MRRLLLSGQEAMIGGDPKTSILGSSRQRLNSRGSLGWLTKHGGGEICNGVNRGELPYRVLSHPFVVLVLETHCQWQRLVGAIAHGLTV